MEPLVQAFFVPKRGNSADEYEDAYAFSAANRHLAMADGATESSFADRWAKDLVSAYVTEPPPVDAPKTPFPAWLAPLQQRWRESIDWAKLPWFAEDKAKTGGFATFLGVTVANPEDRQKSSLLSRTTAFFRKQDLAPKWRWKAVAVGDTCFFHLRDGKLLESFPLTKAEQFSSRPVLLCSNPTNNSGVWPEVRYEEGECLADDTFILATDAIAKWFLEQSQLGGKPWELLLNIRSSQEFADFVARLRAEKTLRNDDTTILIARWKTSNKPARATFFRKTNSPAS